MILNPMNMIFFEYHHNMVTFSYLLFQEKIKKTMAT